MTSLVCGLAPLIKNPSFAYDAEHFFGFYLQIFPLAGPPPRVNCLALMGNVRQVSFPRTQGRIAVTNSEKKGALTLFRKKLVKYMYLQKQRGLSKTSDTI